MVPSVAVREDVLKTIEQTRKHYAAIPGLPPFHPSVYAGQPGQVRAFAASNAVEVMMTTIQSFRNETNVIRKSNEGYAPPINLLQAVRPVLILDSGRSISVLRPLGSAVRSAATMCR